MGDGRCETGEIAGKFRTGLMGSGKRYFKACAQGSLLVMKGFGDGPEAVADTVKAGDFDIVVGSTVDLARLMGA
jgi:hypothetical protein